MKWRWKAPKIRAGSRIARWGVKDERWSKKNDAPPVAALVPVQALQMSQGRERAAICEGRAQAAVTNLTSALRASSVLLEHSRQVRRLYARVSVAAGLSGIACLLFVIHNTEMVFAFSALGTAAACAPLLHIILRIGEVSSIEARTLVEKEKISLLIDQAKLMGRTIVAASDEQGMSEMKKELFDMLLNDLEKVSLAEKWRPSVLRGETPGRTRRAARISPTNKRVIVTIADNTKFHVQILDVSLSGVAVEGLLPGVGVGSDAVVGTRKARVVRVQPHGAAFEFAMPIPAEQFDEHIVL